MFNTQNEKLIRYLIPDLEYRRDNSGNWILCQIAFRGLNRRFEHSFCHNAYFVESLKCPKFVAETVERDFDNEASYFGNLRTPEEYLKIIFQH